MAAVSLALSECRCQRLSVISLCSRAQTATPTSPHLCSGTRACTVAGSFRLDIGVRPAAAAQFPLPTHSPCTARNGSRILGTSACVRIHTGGRLAPGGLCSARAPARARLPSSTHSAACALPRLVETSKRLCPDGASLAPLGAGGSAGSTECASRTVPAASAALLHKCSAVDALPHSGS